MKQYPPLQLSKRVGAISQALSIYINQCVYDLKRQGRDITALSLGEAYFDIPIFDFEKLDFVKGYHYSDSQGIPELRNKIAGFYEQMYGARVNADNEILISAGSKPIIYMAMLAVLNAGDEIIIHEPAWLSYQEQARLVEATVRFIPYDCPVDAFSSHFSPKTRMLIINNPNNPAGRLYQKEELESLYQQCRTHGVYLLVDESYSDFVCDDVFHSIAATAPSKDGIIVVNSLSKNIGMSGWRVGYIISTPLLIGQILKLNQHIITCASTILSYYLAQYFDKLVAITLPQVKEVVAKRQRIAAFLKEEKLECLPGSATFYLFVNIMGFPSSSLDFALALLFEHGISVVPGIAYGTSTERFIRISVGTESEEKIRDALLVIKDLINCKTFDKEALHKKMSDMGICIFNE